MEDWMFFWRLIADKDLKFVIHKLHNFHVLFSAPRQFLSKLLLRVAGYFSVSFSVLLLVTVPGLAACLVSTPPPHWHSSALTFLINISPLTFFFTKKKLFLHTFSWLHVSGDVLQPIVELLLLMLLMLNVVVVDVDVVVDRC